MDGTRLGRPEGGGLHAAVRGCRERTTHPACVDGPASAAAARREYNTHTRHISRILRSSARFDRRSLTRSLAADAVTREAHSVVTIWGTRLPSNWTLACRASSKILISQIAANRWHRDIKRISLKLLLN